MASSMFQPIADPFVETDPVRRERDRFAAFAFCAADVLLELDTSQTVVFATGAVKALLGRPPEDLVGRRLPELASPEYSGLVSAVLSSARAQTRMNPVAIRLAGEHGPTPPLLTTGYFLPRLPHIGGHDYLALRLDTDQLSPGRERHAESGLLDTQSFASAVSRHLARPDRELKVTLVQVGNLDTLRRKLDEESRKALMATVGAYLKASSVDGDSAVQFGEERFGLLHDRNDSIAPVWKQLREFTRAIDPDGVGVDIADSDLDLAALEAGGEGLSQSDIARVLVHAVSAFDVEDMGDTGLDAMTRDLGAVARSAADRIRRFRKTIADGSFMCAFQPIVDVATRRPHHFEALARFSGDAGISAGSEIAFAEEIGLIGEFDLKMVAKVVEWLRTTNRLGMRYHIAINISGRSLSSGRFLADLLALLEDADDVRRQILFELTETSRIGPVTRAAAAVTRLRALGHNVCLDDFGAGAATFQYLRAFDVDVVKIDGALVHEAVHGRKGMAFLTAVVGMCEDLGIITVAEMVEDEHTLEVVREAGVTLAQGLLFGAPATDVSAYEAPRPFNFEGSRRTGG
jgi:EAL domain-containing protein (putative c-di-GMP-specific phosphodiesterase class I)